MPDSSRRVHWIAPPQWHAMLSENGQPPLAQWLRDGQAVVIKHGPHRTVYRVRVPGGQYYLKHDHGNGWLKALLHRLTRSKAHREWVKTQRLMSFRLQTVPPVAWGEVRRAGLPRESFFVTEAVEAYSLEQWLRTRLPNMAPRAAERVRRDLAVRLAHLIAELHRCGVLHDDLHAGNLLLETSSRDQPDEPPRLLLIDMPNVRFARRLSWRACRANLAQLAAALQSWTSHTDWARFWRAYRRARPELTLRSAGREARRLHRQAQQTARQRMRRRDRRPLAENRDFYRLHVGDWQALATRRLDPQVLRRVLSDPHAWVGPFRDSPVKRSAGLEVLKGTIDFEGKRLDVAIKCLSPKPGFKSWFPGHRIRQALQTWQNANALLARGIATPLPLFVAFCRRGPARGQCLLVSQWGAQGTHLHAYLQQLAARPAVLRYRAARIFARRLGELLGRLHAWQYAHPDLKGPNLLATDRPPDDVEVLLIDTDPLRRPLRLTWDNRVANLSRLAASLAVHGWLTNSLRWRFLRAYLRAAQLPRRQARPLWRAVASRAAALLEQRRRQGKTFP